MRAFVLPALALCASSTLMVKQQDLPGSVFSRTGDTQPIFYAIMMGDAPQRNQVRLWLASVRQVGKWQGTVLIVTGKPECLAQQLGSELLGGDRLKTTDDVDIYPGEGTNGRVHIMKVKDTGNIVEMKRQKTYAWSNIVKAEIAHPVSSIVYTDMDIVIGKDLREFVAAVRTSESNKDITMSAFKDKGYAKGDTHTGVVVSYPTNTSAKCLAAWGHNLDGKGNYRELVKPRSLVAQQGVDQTTLGQTYECTKNLNFLDPNFLFMPDTGKLEKGMTAEFVHFTNSARWKDITDADKAKYFYGSLGLARTLDVFGHMTCAKKDTMKEIQAPKARNFQIKNKITSVDQVKAAYKSAGGEITNAADFNQAGDYSVEYGLLHLKQDGSSYYGKLSQDCRQILWSDGDIWSIIGHLPKDSPCKQQI